MHVQSNLAASVPSTNFALIQTLYLLPVLGGHPLLSGCGHPVAVLCLSFFVIFTVLY